MHERKSIAQVRLMVEMTIEHKSKQAKELQSFRLDIIGNDVK
jgi:hypothetical protein